LAEKLHANEKHAMFWEPTSDNKNEWFELFPQANLPKTENDVLNTEENTRNIEKYFL
jgi:hypothetical protein